MQQAIGGEGARHSPLFLLFLQEIISERPIIAAENLGNR